MLKYLFFRASFSTIGLMPTRALYVIFAVIGNLTYYLVPGARRNVLNNLSHVVPEGTPKPEIRRMARQIFRNVALYYVDLARMPYTDTKQLLETRMDVHGLDEHLFPAIAEGRGVIMLSAHMGNPELAGQGLIPYGVKVFALTEPLDPPALSHFLDARRSSRGHTFGSVNYSNVKRVMKTLRSGGVVALMADRDIQGPKMTLPFFGVETLMPTGPIEVAIRTGATVIPSFSARRKDYMIEAIMEEPLPMPNTGDFEADVRAGALAYLERLEKRIAADPGQWLVIESLWDGEETAPTQAQEAETHQEQPVR